MFDPLFHFFADILAWFYKLWPSYGGAIILFTMLIMLVMAPVTIRQTRSMLAMQRLQPEVKRLRERYGNDRERLNQEMMALYQANGVNPLGGCLPMIVQIPVFLVLYGLIRGLTRRVSDIGLGVGDAVGRGGEAAGEFASRTFNPAYLNHDSAMFTDLSSHTEMKWLGLDLSQTPSAALGEGIVHGAPYLLLVVAVGLTSWLQQKQIQGRASQSAMNPTQQAMMKFLPFMLPIFSFSFATALVLYFLASNLFRVGQQVFITKQVYGKHDTEAEIVRPEPADVDRAVGARAAAPKAGGNHGSRRPVTNAPKKRRKPAASATTTPKAGTNTNSKTSSKAAQRRGARGAKQQDPTPPARTSKRVTPKKSAREDSSGSRRRKR
jgi:YidC/Oxa1 family membrane protein insertase